MFSVSNFTIGDSTQSLDHSLTLSHDLGRVFDSGNGCDFMIIVKSGNQQENETVEMVGTTVCAHRMIVSQFPFFNASEGNITVDISPLCQPYFTSFIRYAEPSMTCVQGQEYINITRVINEDVTKRKIYFFILRYLYTRKIDVTFSSAECLHWMASKFGVKQLMEDVGRIFNKFLPEDASFHTQVSLYNYAKESADFLLQENCLQYLAWNFQNLTASPAWAYLSAELLGGLLSRQDLVVPDEYFLLQVLESWITAKGSSISLETQADLLRGIRFPMIPAEKLYQLKSSSLYSTHKNVYQENMLRAFQFNVLLFSSLLSDPKFNAANADYQPRIYTSGPWGNVITSVSIPAYNRQYQSGPFRKSFSTPLHNSLIFQNNKIQWETSIFQSQYECSNQGLRCESLPMARMQSYSNQQKNIVFRNRLLLMCQDRYIFQVQDFKNNMAYITANSTQAFPYPCPDKKFTYIFVVRPEYV